MPLYWAADTDGSRYCVRAANMIEAVEAFRAATAMDPEGIDLAADDDVELIGFDSAGDVAAGSRKPGDGDGREITAGVVRDVLLADSAGFGLGPEYVTETRVARVVVALLNRFAAANCDQSAVTREDLGESRRHEDEA